MKSLNILLVLLFVSCASKVKDPQGISEDLRSYSNDDFKLKKEVSYSSKQDKLSFDSAELIKNNLLAIESLHKGKLYEENLEETALNKLAQNCYNREFDRAISKIKDMQQVYKSNVIFWNQVGNCYLLQNKYRKALLFFNKGLEIKSRYAPILNNIGVMYQLKGEDQKALLAYKKAIAEDRYIKTPKLNISLLYLKYGLIDKAKTNLEALERIQPQDSELLSALGTVELMKNNYDSAIKYFSRIDSDDLEKASFALNYSVALFRKGQKEKAVDIFEDIEDEKNTSYYKKVKSFIGAK